MPSWLKDHIHSSPQPPNILYVYPYRHIFGDLNLPWHGMLTMKMALGLFAFSLWSVSKRGTIQTFINKKSKVFFHLEGPHLFRMFCNRAVLVWGCCSCRSHSQLASSEHKGWPSTQLGFQKFFASFWTSDTEFPLQRSEIPVRLRHCFNYLLQFENLQWDFQRYIH